MLVLSLFGMEAATIGSVSGYTTGGRYRVRGSRHSAAVYPAVEFTNPRTARVCVQLGHHLPP